MYFVKECFLQKDREKHKSKYKSTGDMSFLSAQMPVMPFFWYERSLSCSGGTAPPSLRLCGSGRAPTYHLQSPAPPDQSSYSSHRPVIDPGIDT